MINYDAELHLFGVESFLFGIVWKYYWAEKKPFIDIENKMKCACMQCYLYAVNSTILSSFLFPRSRLDQGNSFVPGEWVDDDSTFGHISQWLGLVKFNWGNLLAGSCVDRRCHQLQCPCSGSVNEPVSMEFRRYHWFLSRWKCQQHKSTRQGLAHRVHLENVNRRLLNLTRRIFLRNINKSRKRLHVERNLIGSDGRETCWLTIMIKRDFTRSLTAAFVMRYQ